MSISICPPPSYRAVWYIHHVWYLRQKMQNGMYRILSGRKGKRTRRARSATPLIRDCINIDGTYPYWFRTILICKIEKKRPIHTSGPGWTMREIFNSLISTSNILPCIFPTSFFCPAENNFFTINEGRRKKIKKNVVRTRLSSIAGESWN